MIGTHLAPGYDMDKSAVQALFSFGFFFLSFLLLRLTSGRLSGNKKYQARIVRIRREPVKAAPCKQSA
ncbi:hypothetical protein DENIS_0502 [Desulfonema ishimotonii]|uniref:Uncharacterized protein n=2 Tax=Desulfonema ishimotonii TaxID=45657 RepID=A0A401FRH4_9BACT|nr:hypothetical protein DENIS_0502 [Desulfonema ishimotonii]